MVFLWFSIFFKSLAICFMDFPWIFGHLQGAQGFSQPQRGAGGLLHTPREGLPVVVAVGLQRNKWEKTWDFDDFTLTSGIFWDDFDDLAWLIHFTIEVSEIWRSFQMIWTYLTNWKWSFYAGEVLISPSVFCGTRPPWERAATLRTFIETSANFGCTPQLHCFHPIYMSQRGTTHTEKQ